MVCSGGNSGNAGRSCSRAMFAKNKQSGYRSGSQLSKIILNNTYTLCYVSYTLFYIRVRVRG